MRNLVDGRGSSGFSAIANDTEEPRIQVCLVADMCATAQRHHKAYDYSSDHREDAAKLVAFQSELSEEARAT
jgi:hypothetical protein